MKEEINFYTRGEEIANAITHGIGTLLAIAALVLLIVFAAKYGDAWYVVSYTIYGSTLVLLYLESTLYHSLTNKKAKKVFRIFDHASIYLLIAGTYTPFTLTILRGALGWTIFGIIWGLAVLGIVMKAIWIGKYDKISTLIYIGMGWMIIIAIKRITAVMPTTGIVLLVVGGLLYTGGCFFYSRDSMPFNHAIWHLFVIAGSTCHFFCILLYLLPS
jgi:hemolysin III